MPVTIATWNINSVRLRIEQVIRFLHEHRPDVLCLQEIKCAEGSFPHGPFRDIGYGHIALNGQKAYHGVATISRLPFEAVEQQYFCGKQDARHVSTRFGADAGESLAGTTLHNFYVPAGGDEPDPEINEKFAHKLDFLKEMQGWSRQLRDGGTHRSILVGDLNIAPLETDVWSHKQLLRVVSHTPVEVEHLDELREAGGWVDLVRRQIPPEQKLYTWWSYRAKDWNAADKGRRLDHIWSSPALADSLVSASVARDVRGWERPSDHAPVLATFR